MRQGVLAANLFFLALLYAFIPVPLHAKTKASDLSGEAHDVEFCEISRDPGAFNHHLVRITGFVTHGFEDFHLADPDCLTQGFSVWMMYGGKAQSGTVYCCPGEGGGRNRSKPLVVEGVHTGLVVDAYFKKFNELIVKERDTIIHGTFTGWFFSGQKQEINGHTLWGGAGHLGCCSLLVLQRVETVDTHFRKDLDYSSEAGWNEPEGCDYGTLQIRRQVSIIYSDANTLDAIEEQRNADKGERPWAFDQPQRVALDALKPLYPDQNLSLQEVKKTDSRYVYRWRHGENQVVVAVTRPYWLSFYAAAKNVVWVATAIKEAGCKN